MTQSLIVTLLFLCSSLVVNAHRHKHEKHRFIPTNHSIAGRLGIGNVGGYVAVSTGLEYERFIVKKGSLSVTLKAEGFLGGSIHFGRRLEKDEVWSRNYGYFIAPGVRFHPLGKGHPVDLGLGISTPVGSGRRRDMIGAAGSEQFHDFFGAVLVEATINFQSAHHSLTSLFATGGGIYSNAEVTRKEIINNPWYVQFGLRLGGRW